MVSDGDNDGDESSAVSSGTFDEDERRDVASTLVEHGIVRKVI